MKPTIDEIVVVDHLAGSALAGEVAFLNARAAAVGARLANRALAPLGLKVRSYSVLSLSSGDRPPSQRQLAEFLQLDPSQVVALVDDLERRDWVRRSNDHSDRRVKVVTATEAGRDVCRRAADATRAAEDVALSMLDAAERTQLVALLRKAALLDPR